MNCFHLNQTKLTSTDFKQTDLNQDWEKHEAMQNVLLLLFSVVLECLIVVATPVESGEWSLISGAFNIEN